MSRQKTIKSIQKTIKASARLISVRRVPSWAWILLVAGLLRLAWVLYSPVVPVSDFEEYRRLATSIAQGMGYSYDGQPTAYRPVGYPLFLAGIFWLPGGSVAAAKLTQVLLGILTVYLTYRLGAQVFQQRTGEVAAWIVACMPSLIAYTSLLASENLAIPLLLLAMLAFVRYLQSGKYRHAFVAGLLCGLTTLVRSEALLLPLAWMIYLALRRQPLEVLARVGLTLVAAVALALSPWIVRNYLAFGRFVPATSNGGILLLAAFDEYTDDPERHSEVFSRLAEEARATNLDEFETSSLAARKAVDYIQRQPWQVARLVPVKLFELLRDDISGISWNFWLTSREVPPLSILALKGLAQLYYVIVVLSSLAAFIYRKSLISYPLYLLLLLPILVWLLYFAFFIATDRYHLLILPLVAQFSAFSIRERWGK